MNKNKKRKKQKQKKEIKLLRHKDKIDFYLFFEKKLKKKD